MKYPKKWFTLVELVVVAVILSILATVGFISYEEYITDTRDSKRLAQLAWLRDGLRLWITKWQLPLPDDNVEIRNNGTPFLYQWYAGENVLEGISYSEATKDPYDGDYYTYLLSRNRKDFQVLWFLEEYNPDVISSIVPESFATDYSQRFPQVMGKKLGILLEQETNTPLQEISEYTASGYMDLQDTTTNLFDAYVTDTQLISGKEIDLIGIIPFTTCKKIKETGGSYGNGIYNINPSGLNPFEVYCDMELDGWWWTLVARSVEWFENSSSFWWLFNTWDIRNDTIPYSLWKSSIDINFKELLTTTYDLKKNIIKAIALWVDNSFIKDENNHVDPGVSYGTYWEDITAFESCRKVYPLSVWVIPCDEWTNLMWEDSSIKDKSSRNILDFWGFFHKNDQYHTYLNRNFGLQGLWPSGWVVWSDDASGDFWPGDQGMIFVR